MNLDKSEVKIGVATEIGCRLEDILEETRREMYRVEGSAVAYRKGAESIEALQKLVDQEMDAGKFDLEQAKQLKTWIGRAHQMLVNLGMQSTNQRMAQAGKVGALEASVQVVKKFRDEESTKQQTILAALKHSEPAIDSPEEGTHPGPSIKARRIAETLKSPVVVPKQAVKTPIQSKPAKTTKKTKR